MPANQLKWRLDRVIRDSILNTSFKTRQNITTAEYRLVDGVMNKALMKCTGDTANLIVTPSNDNPQAGP